ncbi:MAG: right-handed parallel beta-helix repeat-containing protein, partial [Planctomycetota bacterium]
WSEIGVHADFRQCTFSKNTAYWGGAMVNYLSSSPTLGSCIFVNNSAGEIGGAIHNFMGAKPKLVNCTFHKNTAMAGGGGLYNETNASPVLTNCILWGDKSGEPPVVDEICNVDSGSVPVVTCCDIERGYPGAGNINADPLFVDSANFDLHLYHGSPCRDSGDGAAVTDTHDFEGDPRIVLGLVDMGADEFHTHFYCTGDFTPGGEIHGKFVGLPGATPVGLLVGSGVMDLPFHHMWGDFFLEAPWYLIAPLAPIPAKGVLVIRRVIPMLPEPPYAVYMQAIIGNELSNLTVCDVR